MPPRRPFPTPADQSRRPKSLEAVKRFYGLPDERLDRITRLACRMFEVPIALISLLGKENQWFSSHSAAADAPTARDAAFCAYAIRHDELLIIPDTLADPRFADHPLVSGEPHIRFYAGRPLRINQHRIGTLCLIDRRPKALDARKLELFDGLGDWAESELRLERMNATQQELTKALDHARRKALRDPLTGCWNREGIFQLLERELAYANRLAKPFGIAMIDLDHFKSINDRHGHLVGDAILGDLVQRIRSVLRAYDSIGRYGGEEFLLVIPDANREQLLSVAEKVRQRVDATPISTPGATVAVSASIGVAPYRAGDDVNALVERADQALYQAKRSGRNRVCLTE